MHDAWMDGVLLMRRGVHACIIMRHCTYIQFYESLDSPSQSEAAVHICDAQTHHEEVALNRVHLPVYVCVLP
jgi:hypothetical protein